MTAPALKQPHWSLDPNRVVEFAWQMGPDQFYDPLPDSASHCDNCGRKLGVVSFPGRWRTGDRAMTTLCPLCYLEGDNAKALPQKPPSGFGGVWNGSPATTRP